ncbi:hypothetical protein [Thermoplasma sp.]|uniref:hypothetical protein n=1 Tax=Thermoplasma sp. TaxID=1973142 RepID=UPI0012831B74|nr:hypothetical protein [Thermoplasma sp.]KAA8922955.1 MAG: hypothetical protein F6Q11_01765 [Thermoplasma sp.]
MNRIITVIIIATITVPSIMIISHGQPYYNFSDQPQGTFPSNTTNFSFSVLNAASGTDIGIKDIYGHVGLNIFSLDLNSNGTYLNISFDRRNSESVSLVFNYSENGIGGADVNYMIMRAGSSSIGFSFSNSQNLAEYSPYMVHTGITVSANIIYTLKFTFFHNQTLVFLNASGKTLNMPLVFNTSVPAGKTSLLIGSNAVNLTIYNISLNDYPVSLVQPSGLYKIYKTGFSYHDGNCYYPDYVRNSILDINDSGVYVSNYVNMSTYRIITYDSHYLAYSPSGTAVYIAETYHNETHIVSVNLTSLTARFSGVIPLNLTGCGMYASGNDVFFFNDSGTYIYYLKSGDAQRIGNGVFESYDQASGIIKMYNDTSRQFLEYSVSNGSVSAEAFSNTTEQVTGVSDGISSILYNARSDVGVYGDHLLYGNFVASVGLFYQNSDIIIGNMSLQTGLNIEYASAHNSSEILVASGNSIDIMYSGINIPMNGSISMKYDHLSYIRGSSWINFTVNSSYPYYAVMRIGNITETEANGSHFMVNSVLLSNGTQSLSLHVNNSMGYEAEYSGTVFVDNYVPLITSTVNNNSYVLYGENISIGVENDPIISELKVSVDGVDHIYPGNATVVMNRTGMNYVNVSAIDEFGIIFIKDLRYEVYRDQNFSVNIYNGEYFNTSHIPISIYPEGYNFTVVSAGRIICGTDQVVLDGHEGINNVTVYLNYHGDNITVFAGTIYVMTFPPTIIINRTESKYYSFHGDSRNNTMYLNVSTNVSSYIFVRILIGDEVITSMSFVDRASMVFNGSSPYFHVNGNYTISIEAVSPSGTFSYRNLSIYENSTVPASRTYHVFTNSTSLPVPFNTSGLVYNFSLKDNILTLPGYGNYTFVFYEYTSTGNYGRIILDTDASLDRPHIYAMFRNMTMDGTACLQIRVFPMNLTDIGIRIDNSSYETNNGSLIYRIRSDGNLSVVVYGKNIYGNENYSVYELQEYPHPEITSMGIIHHVSLLKTLLHLRLTGYHLIGAGITWYINGRQYTDIYNVSMSNRPGLNVVVVKVSIGNLTKEAQFKFYSPSYAMFSLAGAAVVYPAYIASRNRDLDSLKELITGSDGSSVRDLLKTARKKRFTRKQVMRAIDEAKAAKVITVETDPNGNEFIVGRQ